ncbi:MAG: hypothetical protein NTW87_30240 [Planctomycetota bacterium]|nr:hypothetical protein [Planctomycetota bacterium]
MEVVIVHVTRLSRPGTICVAGVEPGKKAHVRPVLDGKLLTEKLLASHGGPFALGALVDLGRVRPVGRAPALEDHLFASSRARQLRCLAPGEFWQLLEALARPALAELFGPDLRPHGSGLVVDIGKGSASLGCLRSRTRPLLELADYSGRKHIRMRLTDEQGHYSLSVTDQRLYDVSSGAIREAQVAALAERLARGSPVILAMGLGRPWKREDDDAELHWLHVNNIHLADEPLWNGAAM